MITIGADYFGPELRDSKLFDVLSATMKATVDARGDFEFGSTPAVNVVFHVPGSLGGPDWRGSRDGTFSRKEKMLMVQVAVPEELISSDAAIDFIIESLRGANAIAFDSYEEHGLQFPLREAEALVSRIEELVKGEK